MLAEFHPRLPALLERGSTWLAQRKRPVLAVALVALLAVAAIAVCLRGDADVPLFESDLHPAQTTEVRDALTLWGEPFRANAQNTQLFVPASHRRDVLLRLTLAGLPHRYAPTSADVLDDSTNPLTPLSVIDDRRRDGIEGDLVASLRRIGGVADATVVLPPADDEPFAGDDAHATRSAAVQLVMQSGAQLSNEAVGGIKRFVAAAYPGLTPDNVTVVDGSGAVMGSAPAPDRALSKERRVQTAVQSALDAVLGAGAAVVRVDVRTADAEASTQSTRVIPHGVISSDSGIEHGSEAGRHFDKERTVQRFAYDTISDRRSTPAGAQVRISVAVFLDARRVDPSTCATIASLVRAAAGADLSAGDDVVVQALPFAVRTAQAAAGTSRTSVASRALVPVAVILALALLGVALGKPVERLRLAELTRQNERHGLAPEHARALAHIAGESAQTAAYVLANLPPDARRCVLEACDARRRRTIALYLKHHHDC